jgi:hypothetical protein
LSGQANSATRRRAHSAATPTARTSVSESFQPGFCVRFVSETGTLRTQKPSRRRVQGAVVVVGGSTRTARSSASATPMGNVAPGTVVLVVVVELLELELELLELELVELELLELVVAGVVPVVTVVWLKMVGESQSTATLIHWFVAPAAP